MYIFEYLSSSKIVQVLHTSVKIVPSYLVLDATKRLYLSGGRYPGFLIKWIFYWIESSQIEMFESIFELNFPGKNIFEYIFEWNIPEKLILKNPLNWILS